MFSDEEDTRSMSYRVQEAVQVEVEEPAPCLQRSYWHTTSVCTFGPLPYPTRVSSSFGDIVLLPSSVFSCIVQTSLLAGLEGHRSHSCGTVYGLLSALPSHPWNRHTMPAAAHGVVLSRNRKCGYFVPISLCRDSHSVLTIGGAVPKIDGSLSHCA